MSTATDKLAVRWKRLTAAQQTKLLSLRYGPRGWEFDANVYSRLADAGLVERLWVNRRRQYQLTEAGRELANAAELYGWKVEQAPRGRLAHKRERIERLYQEAMGK